MRRSHKQCWHISRFSTCILCYSTRVTHVWFGIKLSNTKHRQQFSEITYKFLKPRIVCFIRNCHTRSLGNIADIECWREIDSVDNFSIFRAFRCKIERMTHQVCPSLSSHQETCVHGIVKHRVKVVQVLQPGFCVWNWQNLWYTTLAQVFVYRYAKHN